jgi:AmmeMemoRadiSam system protein B
MAPPGVYSSNVIRQPAVAGQFYPASPAELQQQITTYLDQTDVVDHQGEIVALVARAMNIPD